MVNKGISIVVLLFACALGISNAHAGKPKWVFTTPTPSNKSYCYKVTRGEAKTYDEAYTKALARAILETSWKISGVTVRVNDNLKTVEQNITESLETISKEVRIHINKICEYSENPSGSMKINVYLLWQVPSDGYTTPQFDNSYNCE